MRLREKIITTSLTVAIRARHSGPSIQKTLLGNAAHGQNYRHALFYKYPGGLRFELSEGGHPLDQVLVALRKATAICSNIFDNDDLMLVHLQKFAPPSRYGLRSTLRELDLAGITIPPTREIWLGKDEGDSWDESGDEPYWVNMAFELPLAKLQNLLWCALAIDFGPLHPNPHCLVYLLNIEKEIIVHP